MRYKVDVMTSSKREAAGIGDGASQLKLTQQKQQNTGCQKSEVVWCATVGDAIKIIHTMELDWAKALVFAYGGDRKRPQMQPL